MIHDRSLCSDRSIAFKRISPSARNGSRTTSDSFFRGQGYFFAVAQKNSTTLARGSPYWAHIAPPRNCNKKRPAGAVFQSGARYRNLPSARNVAVATFLRSALLVPPRLLTGPRYSLSIPVSRRKNKGPEHVPAIDFSVRDTGIEPVTYPTSRGRSTK